MVKRVGAALVVAAALLLTPAVVTAQTIYSEDFEAGPAGPLPAGWALFNVDGSAPATSVSYVNAAWVLRQDFAYDPTDFCAFSTSWYNPVGIADDWMITPAIGLTTNNVLSWNAVTYDPAYPDGYEVRISTTGQTPAGCSANPPLFATAAENTAWTARSVDLQAAGYANQTVYIAFRNNSNDKFVLLIDDILVEMVMANQTITFGAAPTVVVGGSGTLGVAGGASTSSVLASSTTPGVCAASCTNAAGVTDASCTIYGVAVGTCTIVADQAGDAFHYAADRITLDIAVGKGSQTIAFGAASGLIVGGSGALSATGGASMSSVLVSSATPAVCAASCTNATGVTDASCTISGLAFGTCTIVANQAGDASYNPAGQASLDIAVGKGGQTIAFGAVPRVLVGGAGALSAAATSGFPVVFSSASPAVCTVRGSSVVGLTPGTCTVAADQPGDSNYTAALQARQTITVAASQKNDFDGDGSSDIGCYHPPSGSWYAFGSTDGFWQTQFGYAGTLPVSGDFDGDGRSDIGCYYPAGGNWYVSKSTEGFAAFEFGYAGTIPFVGDFDGDGRSDIGCYHPTSGTWYQMKSTEGFATFVFGYAGTIPIVGDFDGDGKGDVGCYDPPAGTWYLMKSTEGFATFQFGYDGTVPIIGDFDGDGRDDIGCYYPPGGIWYVLKSTDGFWQTEFGYAGTEPVVGDFDGDGKSDLGCYYPAGGNWYVFKSAEGFWQTQFGYEGTMPLGGTLR